MKTHKMILISLVMFLMCGIAFSEQIHVSPDDNLQDVFKKLSNGDIIFFSPGTYYTNSALRILDKKNIKLMGHEEVKIICKNIFHFVLDIRNSESIEIKNLILTHKKDDSATCKGSVIYIVNTSRINILGSELSGCGLVGVDAYGSSKIYVENCYIHSNSWCAFNLYKVNDIKILNNYIVNNNKFMYASEVQELEMEGNEIINNKQNEEPEVIIK